MNTPIQQIRARLRPLLRWDVHKHSDLSTPAHRPLSSLAAQTHHPSETSASAATKQQAGTHTHAQVLDGKSVSTQWIDEMSVAVAEVTALQRRPPGLAVILVGKRADSLLYVSKKQEAAHRAGIAVHVYPLPEHVTQEGVEAAVRAACLHPDVDGVLIQLPLPRHLSEEDVMAHLDPHKDVDGFHPLNMGRILMRGRTPYLVPCTPLGCMELLKRSGISVRGKSAVVVGDSNIVGTPLAAMLRDEGAAAVTVCHRISYSNWFSSHEASLQLQDRARAAASACLPQLPGPRPVEARPAADVTPTPTLTSNSPSLSSPSVAAHLPHLTPVTPTLHPSQPTSSLSPSQHDSHQPSTSQPSNQAPSAPSHESDSPQSNSSTLSHEPPPSQSQNSHSGSTPSSQEPSQELNLSGQLPGICRAADILVVACGCPELVRADWVKPGAVVLDVGINVMPAAEKSGGVLRSESEASRENASAHHPFHVVGDVCFAEVSKVASALSPVPGGLGPMTIAALLHNTVRAANLTAQSARSAEARAAEAHAAQLKAAARTAQHGEGASIKHTDGSSRERTHEQDHRTR